MRAVRITISFLLSGIFVPQVTAQPTASTPEANGRNGVAAQADISDRNDAKIVAEAIRSLKPAQEGQIEAPCEYGQRKLDSDLCAQWYAGKAATDAAFWSKIHAALAFLGTLLLMATLYLTRAMARSATDAVSAARDAIEVARDATAHAAEANGIAVDALDLGREANNIADGALAEERRTTAIAIQEFMDARRPRAVVVGMALDAEWPSLFNAGNTVQVTATVRNLGRGVARRVGMEIDRIVIRDAQDRIITRVSERERLSPVRPGIDVVTVFDVPREVDVKSRAHNIEVVGRLHSLGDLMMQAPEPFRWISDRRRGGGVLIETWPDDETNDGEYNRAVLPQLIV